MSTTEAVSTTEGVGSNLPPLAILGGTFDPVHHGHLRMALEARRLLRAETLRLIPCHQPPHRAQPGVSADRRLAMVRMAVADEPGLEVDDLELRRDGPSYSIDTLKSLRAELGDKRPLVMLLGADALLKLPSWADWQALLDWAHILAMGRPGWSFAAEGELGHWWRQHEAERIDELGATPAGRTFWQALPALDISATAIRADIRAGHSVRWLVPDEVLNYIRRHRLYF